MATFGEVLRGFRQASNDPDRQNKRLTQERLGELIGHEMMDYGFSGAAISDWERGESKINADDRNVLTSLIKVLHKCGGLKTLVEADQLLEAGNYWVLNEDETQLTFGDITDGIVDGEDKTSSSLISFLVENIFGISQTELRGMVRDAKDGPSPSWPRVFVAIFRKLFDHVSASDILALVICIWVWWLTWFLITPSLRWPFFSRDSVILAVVMYASGVLLIPAVIGILTNTKNNEFWQKNEIVKQINLRLYTHQGASVGFHLGYFFLFTVSLLGYNLGISSTRWLEFLAMLIPMILSYVSARLVPYNLLIAYKKLELKDGAIFFVFPLVGPVWAYLFFKSYNILLARSLGLFIFLSAFTLLLLMMVVRYRQSGTTIIPIRWWVIFWGFILICQVFGLFAR